MGLGQSRQALNHQCFCGKRHGAHPNGTDFATGQLLRFGLKGVVRLQCAFCGIDEFPCAVCRFYCTGGAVEQAQAQFAL